jgi:PKD repeat protein
MTCATPPNDFCGSAEPIACGDILTGSTASATADAGITGDCDSPAGSTGNGVWYVFQGNGQDVTFSTCSAATTFDTELNVYSGTCGALTCLAFNDDDNGCSFSGLRSTVSFFATAGVTYYVRVSYWDSSNSASGSFELSATCNCTADAGTITADATTECLAVNAINISATHDGNSTVPTGYVQAYALTDAATLTILQVGANPSFGVTTGGDYIIHTVIYDPLQIDPTTLPPGTTGFDINALLIQGGGAMCGALDVVGAPITVIHPVAGTITADATPVCIEDGGLISATPDGNQVVPTNYVQGYALTQGGIILQVGSTPSFTVGAAGTYTIHTVVYDPAGLNPSLAIGLPASAVNAQLVQGGGSVCASLDLTGATILVESCVPANDLCSGAISIACGQTVSGSTTDATADIDPSISFCGTELGDAPGVWYSWVSDGSDITVTTCDQATYDTKIGVYTGSCGALTCVDGNDDDFNCSGNTSSVLDLATQSGQTYYFYVSGWNGAVGDFDLTLTCVAPPTPPANDDVCGATALSLGSNGPFDVTGATVQAGEPVPGAGTGTTSCESQDGWCSGDLAIQNSVWFTFVAPASGTVTVNTDGSYDTQVAVYEALNCTEVTNGTTLLGANDDNANYITTQFSSELTLCGLTAGATYYVQVDGFLGDEADLYVTLSEPLVSSFSSSATNLDVDFTDASTSVAGIASWSWDFGDGGSSADQNPSYSYAAEGTFTVCLTVTDVNGCSSTYCESVTVTDIATTIAQAVDNGMTVYPNPSNGQFVVEVRGVEADVQLIVMDVAGRQVYNEGIVLNGSFRKSMTLDVAKGSYLLQIVTLEGTVSRMIQVH